MHYSLAQHAADRAQEHYYDCTDLSFAPTTDFSDAHFGSTRRATQGPLVPTLGRAERLSNTDAERKHNFFFISFYDVLFPPSSSASLFSAARPRLSQANGTQAAGNALARNKSAS